jgi:hypothetical protein
MTVLTKADDYPIHQTSEPIAFAGTDRNFYDRYFFNGYPNADDAGGDGFFATALGVYPHLNVMDASFSVIADGIQHNVHASRVMNMERLDTRVGPIAIDVVEPLQSLRIRVDDAEHDIRADITFHGRVPAHAEPRFLQRIGPRTVMDYTRLTQNGEYEGWIEVAGRRFELARERIRGTRDRSWGVRPVGAGDSQPVAPPRAPQFYWLWAPLNFDDRISLYHINADSDGKPWNTHAVVCTLDGVRQIETDRCRSDLVYKPGTRHARSAMLWIERPDRREITIELTPRAQFYMSGLGYMSPEWGHGRYKGELAVGYEAFDLSKLDETKPEFLHIQALCHARMTDGQQVHEGVGVLEQLILGPHTPSGLTGVLDPAK